MHRLNTSIKDFKGTVVQDRNKLQVVQLERSAKTQVGNIFTVLLFTLIFTEEALQKHVAFIRESSTASRFPEGGQFKVVFALSFLNESLACCLCSDQFI
jgi:hypothetical protein